MSPHEESLLNKAKKKNKGNVVALHGGDDSGDGAGTSGGADGSCWPSPNDPMSVARRFVMSHRSDNGGALLLRSWRGGWMRWTPGGCWVDVEDRAVRKDVYAVLEGATYFDDDKNKDKPWQPNRYKVANVLEALAAVTHLPDWVTPPAWIDGAQGPPAPEVVACANGLLHVRTRQLIDHDPRFFTQVAVPFAYEAEGPEPLTWLRFLKDLWPDESDVDAVEALQEFFGYVLSGRTDQHKILLIVGPTRAGKGVIARVLKALVGAGNVAGPTLSSIGTNFGLSPLIGKPLAVISDARLGGANVHQTVERLLSISGEDTLTIDRKFRDPWTGKVPTRFVIISNELPNFGDASGAIARRFVVLTLTQSWLGQEQPDLTDELLGELPGILRWSLDGLDRLARRCRFTEPRSSADAVVALQDIVSPCSAFVRDCCERGPHEVPVKDLFEAWQAWCETNGHRSGSSQTFGRDIRAVIPGLRQTKPRIGVGGTQVRHYSGLRLQPAMTQDASQRVSGPGEAQ